jgi:hypothetical protein
MPDDELVQRVILEDQHSGPMQDIINAEDQWRESVDETTQSLKRQKGQITFNKTVMRDWEDALKTQTVLTEQWIPGLKLSREEAEGWSSTASLMTGTLRKLGVTDGPIATAAIENFGRALGWLGPLASVVGVAFSAWELGLIIDDALRLDRVFRTQKGLLEDIAKANEESAEGQELLRRVNEKYGTSFTKVAEAEEHAIDQRLREREAAEELAKELKRLEKARHDAAVAATKAADAEMAALDSFQAQKDVFQSLTGDELFSGLDRLQQFAREAPAINELLAGDLTEEQKQKLAMSIAEAAHEGHIDGWEQFEMQLPFVVGDSELRKRLADDLKELASDPQVKAAFDEIESKAMIAQTDALIASFEDEEVQSKAEELGQKVGEGVQESTEKAMEVVVGSVEAINAQAKEVRSEALRLRGGDLSQAPEAVQILFEMLRREGSQAFTGGSSRRLNTGELAGLENIFAAGDIGQVQELLALLMQQRQAFSSGRVTGGNRSAQTFKNENINLQIRFLEQLEDLLEDLADKFPQPDQPVELSQRSIVDLARELRATR